MWSFFPSCKPSFRWGSRLPATFFRDYHGNPPDSGQWENHRCKQWFFGENRAFLNCFQILWIKRLRKEVWQYENLPQPSEVHCLCAAKRTDVDPIPSMWVWPQLNGQSFVTAISCWVLSEFTGWWLSHPSGKYEFVTWDDDIPNIWENKKMFPTFKCVYIYIYIYIYIDTCTHLLHNITLCPLVGHFLGPISRTHRGWPVALLMLHLQWRFGVLLGNPGHKPRPKMMILGMVYPLVIKHVWKIP